jgi:glycosyltransferase involved in cell wall biosynthesis
MSRVSVVVPNYNHARFLRRRLDSILAQTIQDFELIVLDDASTDESLEVIRLYCDDPRVRLEISPVNSGSPFKAWNKGVALARAPYVWIAESDDWAHPRLLERLLPLLEARPHVGIAYCRSFCVDQADQTIMQPKPFGNSRWDQDFIRSGRAECADQMSLENTIPNASAVVFRADSYRNARGADETYRLCGDWLTWSRMMLLADVAYVAEPLNYFRQHQHSVRANTHDSAKAVEERRAVDAIARMPSGPWRQFRSGMYLRWARAALDERRRAGAIVLAIRGVASWPWRKYGWRIMLWTLLGNWFELRVRRSESGATR